MMQQHKTSNSISIAAMIAILVLTAWLGTRGLTFDSIWYDEWRSLVYIGKTTVDDTAQFSGTLGRVVSESDALNPPAYYFLLSIWGSINGAEVPVLRYFSVLLGVLAVAMVYRVGADVVSPTAGVYAAAILGTLALFSVFMHEMRTYSLAVLVVSTHLWTYWRCNRTSATKWDYLAFTLLIALALHTHYTAVLMLGGTFMYHLLFVRKRWRIIGLYFVAAALLIPWAAVVINAGALDSVQNRDDTAMSTLVIVQTLNRFFGNDFAWLPVVPLLLAALTFNKSRVLWTHAIIGLAAYITLNSLVSFACCVRYMVVMLPGLALLAGVGLARWHYVGVIFVVLWVGTGIYTAHDLRFAHNVTNTPRWHYPWQPLHEQVAPQLQPDDTVIALLPGGIADWVHDGLATHFFPNGNAVVVDTWRSFSEVRVISEVVDLTQNSPRVWVAYQSSWEGYHQEGVFRQLDMMYTACGTVFDGDDLHLLLYTAETCP